MPAKFNHTVEKGLKPLRPWTEWLFDINGDIDVYLDIYPVTKGHMLFVPKGFIENWDRSKTNAPEQILTYSSGNPWELIPECMKQAYIQGNKMVQQGLCDGFNVGLNAGKASGQTVAFPHVHLIPRRDGDMKDPAGGIRYCIPDRGNYHTSPHYSKTDES